jgi:hypothetical protein
MSDLVEVLLPELFIHPLFYPEIMTLQFNTQISIEDGLEQDYFIFDIAADIKLPLTLTPWKNTEEVLPLLLDKWEHKKEEIGGYFQNRDRASAKEPMIRSLSYLICFLSWTNEKPVNSLQNLNKFLSDLKYKPINIEERLAFITSNPDHYHSFVQLTQLFEEFKKQYFKIRSLKKVSPKI